MQAQDGAAKNVYDNADLNLNGMEIVARTEDAIYLRIPKAVQMTSQFAKGQCSCGKCDGQGTWDTLAIPLKPTDGKEWAYTVHMPDPKWFLEMVSKNTRKGALGA